MEVTGCWYDSIPFEIVLIVYLISGKSAFLYAVYLSSVLAACCFHLLSTIAIHHRLSPFNAVYRCRPLPFTIRYRRRPYRVSPTKSNSALEDAEVTVKQEEIEIKEEEDVD